MCGQILEWTLWCRREVARREALVVRVGRLEWTASPERDDHYVGDRRIVIVLGTKVGFILPVVFKDRGLPVHPKYAQARVSASSSSEPDSRSLILGNKRFDGFIRVSLDLIRDGLAHGWVILPQ